LAPSRLHCIPGFGQRGFDSDGNPNALSDELDELAEALLDE